MDMQPSNETNTIREFYMTLTQRGQVTLPAEVRRVLKAQPFKKIKIVLSGDEVRIEPITYTLEDVYGAVAPLHHPEDFKRLSREAREERAEHGAHQPNGIC